MFSKLSFFLFFLFFITGCSSSYTVTYTNLGNKTSQEEVYSVIKNADVPKGDIEKFMNYVDIYNQNNTSLVGNFIEIEDQNNVTTEAYKSQNESNKPNDPNSLIPTFILVKDFITTNNTGNENDSYLSYNLNLINTVSAFSMDETDCLKFITTFNSISVAGIKNNEITHMNQIEKTFNDRDFTIKKDQKISLITLWLHSAQENIRYVNNSGVLIDNDSELYYIEKYGSNAPYQVTKFNNRTELKKYLLSRGDLKGDENDGPPLIFENNKYLNK